MGLSHRHPRTGAGAGRPRRGRLHLAQLHLVRRVHLPSGQGAPGRAAREGRGRPRSRRCRRDLLRRRARPEGDDARAALRRAPQRRRPLPGRRDRSARDLDRAGESGRTTTRCERRSRSLPPSRFAPLGKKVSDDRERRDRLADRARLPGERKARADRRDRRRSTARTVHSPTDIFHAMSGKPIGTHFRFTVLRSGHQALVRLTTVAAAAGSKRGVVGVLLGPEREDQAAGQGVDRRARRRRAVGRPRVRARHPAAARAQRRPRPQDRRDRRDLPRTAASARSAESSKRRSARARRVWMSSSFRWPMRPRPASTHTACASSL